MDLSEAIRRSLWEKRKYHAKVLSESALLANYERMWDTGDLFAWYAWILSDLFTNLSISVLSTMGFDPLEFEQLSLVFETRLPSIEELLQGILIVIERGWLPGVGGYEDWVLDNIKEEYQEAFLERLYAKARYGYSKYGTCYYDPVGFRQVLSNLLQRLFLERIPLTGFRQGVDSLPSLIGIPQGLVEGFYNRFVLHMESLRQSFVLGYGILGYSKLSPHGSDEAVVSMVDYRGNQVDVRFRSLDHVHHSMILGITPLGYGYLGSQETVYREPSPPCAKWSSDLAVNTINRYPATPWALGNYSRPEEMRDWLKSERADQHQSLGLLRLMLEHMVENLLEPEGLPVTVLRQYKNAVNHLLAAWSKRHAWGYSPLRSAGLEELRDWWLDYWGRQGLNRSLLEKIFGVVGRRLPRLAEEKRRLG